MAERNNSRLIRILTFIERNGMATTAKLDDLFFDGNIDSRKAFVAKAVRDGLLRAFPLFGNLKYYTVGPNAEKRFALKASVGPKGYGPAALKKRTAIFDYCTSATPLRSRLLLGKPEFAEAFPELIEGLENLQDQYVFELNETGQPKRLITFVVDAAVKIRTLTSNVRKICNKRQQNKAFRFLMDEGAFVVVVLTHCKARVTELSKALSDPEKMTPRAITEVHLSPLLEKVLGNA